MTFLINGGWLNSETWFGLNEPIFYLLLHRKFSKTFVFFEFLSSPWERRHDIQYNGIQKNDIQYNGIQKNDIQ